MHTWAKFRKCLAIQFSSFDQSGGSFNVVTYSLQIGQTETESWQFQENKYNCMSFIGTLVWPASGRNVFTFDFPGPHHNELNVDLRSYKFSNLFFNFK